MEPASFGVVVRQSTSAKIAVFQGTELYSEARKMWAHLMSMPAVKAWPRWDPELQLQFPEIKFRKSSSGFVSGFACQEEHRALIRLGNKSDIAEVLEVILHELVHLACPVDLRWSTVCKERFPDTQADTIPKIVLLYKAVRAYQKNKNKTQAHNIQFLSVLEEAAETYFGIKVDLLINASEIVSKEWPAYVMDDLIVRSLRERLNLPWVRGEYLQAYVPQYWANDYDPAEWDEACDDAEWVAEQLEQAA